MPYRDLREFLARLEAEDQLRRVMRPVSTRFEIAAGIRRMSDVRGPALLFENVVGHTMRVVGAVFADRKKALLALDVPTPAVGNAKFLEGLHHPLSPRLVERGPCQEVVLTGGDVDLFSLPLPVYSEKDGGAYVSAAVAISEDPLDGSRNASIYRLMRIDRNHLAVMSHAFQGLGTQIARAEQRGLRLPVALANGVDPVINYASQAKVPHGVDELGIAGAINGAPVDLVRCATVDLAVPATTEIVIEGRFLPNVRRDEGPFGEFMGYYTPVGQNAVFEVLGVTCRKDAIFHSILCGSAEEVLTLELSVAANVYQRINAVLPGIIDVTCQPFVLHTVVKIRQQYEGHGRQVLLAVFGAEPTWAKTCTVVDEDVDIYDMNDVMWAVLTRSRPDKDVLVIPETPSFYRDPHKEHWGRLGIDATVPYARRHEYERKKIPGADQVDLAKWFGSQTG